MKTNSPALQKIEDLRKETLISLYNQCLPEQQLLFRRMYSHKDLDATIQDIADKIPSDKFDWAIQQCERTVLKNNQGTPIL